MAETEKLTFPILVDEDLVVRWRNTGSSSAQAVTAAVETVLAGGTP